MQKKRFISCFRTCYGLRRRHSLNDDDELNRLRTSVLSMLSIFGRPAGIFGLGVCESCSWPFWCTDLEVAPR
jgi:hypothetical protein